MTELKRVISVSKSVKVQHEGLGGAKYESSDFWSSESEEVPADLSPEDVEDVRLMLRERVEADIAFQVARLKDSFKKPPVSDHYGEVASQTPPRAESHPSSSEGAKSLSVAHNAPGAPFSGGSGVAKPTFRRVPANSIPATPKVPLPDTESGAPF